jgi:signal transduction histidine kinase/ActR/RegA family two-component response regulator
MHAPLHAPDVAGTTRLWRDVLAGEQVDRTLLHELQVHQTELAQQVEELQEACAAGVAKLSRYVELYEQAPVGLLTIDRNGTVHEVNVRALALLQCSREEIVGSSVLARLTPPTRDAMALALVRTHRRTDKDGVDLGIRLDSDAQRSIHADICAGGGEDDHLLVALTDTSSRLQVQAELDHTREILELSNRIARVGIWEFDLQNQRMVWSAVTKEIFGLDPGLQPTLDEATAFYKAGANRDRLLEAVADAVEHGRPFDLELQITTVQGREVWVRKIGVPEVTEGRCRRLYGTFQDIDARMQAEALRLDQARADAANRAKSAFISRMSHELRTPLNAVLGFAYLLQNAPAVKASARELSQVRHIHAAGQHLLQLVDDIMDLSRIESGRTALDLHHFDVGPLVAQGVGLVEVMASARGIKIELAASACPCAVLADPKRVRQVLHNLLSNAIKYNHDGGSVRVNIDRRPAQVAIAVHDTGPGLTPSQIGRLFEPFNRLGAERSTVAGTGLGLVIARSLVQAMDGTLDVHSTPGEGSVFTVRLPGTQADVASDFGRIGPPAPPPAPDAMKAVRLLYIEDNPVSAELMRHAFFGRPGVQLSVVTDGETGLQAARSLDPHLILLDMHLPRLDGMAVFRCLQADPVLARIPCVAMSSDAMAADIERAMAAGFTGYMTKPIDIGHVLALVERLRGPTGLTAPRPPAG